METVVFTKNGLKFKKYNKYAKINTFLPYLRSVCKIQSKVTLLDMLNAIEKNNLHEFVSCYSWCQNILSYHKEARLPRKEKANCKSLEVYWDYQLISDELLTSTSFHGVGKDGTKYALDLSPLNDIAHLPVKLNENLEVVEYEKGKEIIVFKCKKEFSLLEVLDAIYWEVGFFGNIKERDNMIDTLKERVEEIKKLKLN